MRSAKTLWLLEANDTDDEGDAGYLGFGYVKGWIVRVIADEAQRVGGFALHEAFAE